MKEKAEHLPGKFELELYGFPPRISLWIEGEELHYQSGSDEAIQTITPTRDDWRAFWEESERLGLWSWGLGYCRGWRRDGYIWRVQIERNGRVIDCFGENAFPGDFGVIVAGDMIKNPALRWQRFTDAVAKLIGGLPFIWEEWDASQVPSHELQARIILGEFLEKLPAQPRDGFRDRFSISIADLDMSWFRLCIELEEFCIIADTDETTASDSLYNLHEAAEFLGRKIGTTYVDFDDESADTPRLIFTSDHNGNTRFTIIDYCAEKEPPRLDISVSTKMLVEKLLRAIDQYTSTTTLEMDGLFIDY